MSESPSSHPKRRRRQGETYYEAQAAAEAETDRLRHIMPNPSPALTPTPTRDREVLSIAEHGEQAVMERDFYCCPNTGEWVYRWADERIIAEVSR